MQVEKIRVKEENEKENSKKNAKKEEKRTGEMGQLEKCVCTVYSV